MIDPHRKAIIKGCKDRYVSHGNPIGSGRAIVVPADLRGEVFGIRIHEAAIHNDDVSLLSEYQAREFGTVINSVALRHLPHGTEHAQTLSLSEGVYIPFQVRQALMTLTVRPPTESELRDVYFHDLTAETPWKPYLSLIHI